MTIDTSFARAALILPKEFSKVSFYVVGAGGTGSFAALNVARLYFELWTRGKAVELTIIDPDRVEANNIPRSNFCAAEIGRFKAQTLAERISQAWGLETGYACERFDYEKHIKPRTGGGSKQMTIFVGCVDNHLARREINLALQKCEPYYSTEAPNAWWIDGGNGKVSGQVLIGSTVKIEAAENYFATTGLCRKLPAPSIFHPELLEPEIASLRPQRESDGRAASCPELVSLGEQSLNINSRVAVEISEMLTALLLTNSLRRFAAYFDLESGTSRSLYCTPEQIEKAFVIAAQTRPPTKLKRRKKSSGRIQRTDFYAR